VKNIQEVCMEVKVASNEGGITVKLKGDIYVDQADELVDVFNSIVEKEPREVIIDINGLKSITSSGIGKIVLLYKNLQKKDGKLKIIGVNDTIMQIFKIVKLDKLVEIEGA
jgi:anti-sigma B factor antagonist